MTNCLTQAHLLLKESSLSLITAATDGHVTLWDLTSTLEPFYIVDSSTLALRRSLQSSPVSSETIACENRYQVHSWDHSRVISNISIPTPQTNSFVS